MAEQIQQRQVAVKIRISDILNGKYIKEEGWTPNYILTKNGIKASRVNLLGVMISPPSEDMNYKSATIDDGTSQISVRSFEEGDLFQGINIGDAIFVIGRPREYNNEIYVLPEIIKKVENKIWIEVRKLEIENELKILRAQNIEENVEVTNTEDTPQIENTKEEVISENNEEIIGNINDLPEIKRETVKNEEPSPYTNNSKVTQQNLNSEPTPTEIAKGIPQQSESPTQKVYKLIKKLDNGEGAEFEQILEKSKVENAEKIISQLLMEGEIFELGKGKLKVLE